MNEETTELEDLNSYYKAVESGNNINVHKKSTLDSCYGERVNTIGGTQEVIKELETECTELTKMIEFNNYNVPPRVLISLGTKKELLEKAKKRIE